MSREHTLDASKIHHDWDGAREPVLAIQSGDVVHYELLMAGHGQVEETSSVDEVVWDFETIYNLAGPLHVDGALPGQTLEIEVLELTPGPWGWTAFIPGFGLLADDFPEPFLKTYDLRGGSTATVLPASRCRSSRSSGPWACRPTTRDSCRHSHRTRVAATWTAGTS